MNKAIMFIIGAATGSVVTWYVVKEKYRRLANEEIESVVKRFKDKDKKEDKKESNTPDYFQEAKEQIENKKNITDYSKEVSKLGYSVDDYTVEVEVGPDVAEPFVIAPADFGEMPGYNTKSWTYYADYVLADENDNIVDDPESIIGDALFHFGDYEDDSVYVRNDNVECDYEILKHDKTFSELFKDEY